MKLAINPEDRLHLLVWRSHPTAPDSPGWRLALAINCIPITFGMRFQTWGEAMCEATWQIANREGNTQ